MLVKVLREIVPVARWGANARKTRRYSAHVRLSPPMSAFPRPSHDSRPGCFSHHRAATDLPAESTSPALLRNCRSSRRVRSAGGSGSRSSISRNRHRSPSLRMRRTCRCRSDWGRGLRRGNPADGQFLSACYSIAPAWICRERKAFHLRCGHR